MRTLIDAAAQVGRALMQLADELRGVAFSEDASRCDELSVQLAEPVFAKDVDALCDAAGTVARELRTLAQRLHLVALDEHANRCQVMAEQLSAAVRETLVETQPIQLQPSGQEDE